jgi:ketosteroid isomerase-like protein
VKKAAPFAALCMLCLTACSSTGERASAPDLKQLFADYYVAPFKAGNAAAWSSIFAPDAVALHDRREADIGQAAISKFGEMVARHLIIDRFDVSVEEVRFKGDWAYTRGSYNTRLINRNTGQDSGLGGNGKFFLLWERQVDGQWKVIIDMGNRKS